MRIQRKGSPTTLLLLMETGAASVEKVRKTLKKLKLELPFGPAIYFCEYIQRSENNYWKQYLHYHAHSQDLKTT